MTPQPPREYVAFVAAHLRQLRHDAHLLADDEYEAHELYSQALTDIAIRWQWFALLRRLNRPDGADAYLHEALIRRSTRRQAEQAEFVDFEVWFSDHPQPIHPAPGGRPDPPGASPRPVTAPTRPIGAARTLPMASLGFEIGPVAEATVAWWHAYVAHRHARIGVITAAVALVLAIVLPFLQRH